MRCPNCGMPCRPNSRFCAVCGATIASVNNRPASSPTFSAPAAAAGQPSVAGATKRETAFAPFGSLAGPVAGQRCPRCGATVAVDSRFCAHCGQPFLATPYAPAGYGPAWGVVTPTGQYAGFWRRVAAYMVDLLIMIGCEIAVGIFVALASAVTAAAGANQNISNAYFGALYYTIIVIGGWLYFALMESSDRRATFGKKALGLVVSDLNGNRISFGRATGRYFGKIVSGMILCIGFAMAGFTDRKQALHDMMAGTLVVMR